MFELAQRNNVLHTLPCKTLDEMRAAYNFEDLQSFLDVYYAGCAALICEQVCTSLRPAMSVLTPCRTSKLDGLATGTSVLQLQRLTLQCPKHALLANDSSERTAQSSSEALGIVTPLK